MSGLFSLLSSTTTALNAQSQAIAITGNNISNVNNPNYSDETVDYQSLGTVQTEGGLESAGISVSVSQQRDSILDQMVQQEASLTSNLTAQQSVLEQAQASLGESVTNTSTTASSGTTSASGLSAAIDGFFDTFQSFAADPSDGTQNQSVVQQAGVLTDRFQQADQNLALVQTGATQQATSGIASANSLLQQVAQINSQINSLEVNSPGSAVQLRDQREGDLETLAGLVPISVTQGATGEDQISTSDANGNPVVLVSNATVSNSLSLVNGVVSAGSPAVALGLSSGSIQGSLTASTGAVQTLRTSLDQLAQQIVTAVNSAYNPTGAAGGNFFSASGTTAGTIAVDPNLTAATLQSGDGTPGDNSIALAVAGVANQNFSTAGGDLIDGTINQSYAGTVTSIGQAVSTMNSQVTNQTDVQTVVSNERSSVSGVSIDEEMSNLVSYQRAYQASSEVFQVVDDLLENIVTNLASIGG